MTRSFIIPSLLVSLTGCGAQSDAPVDAPQSEVDYGECEGDAETGCDDGKPVCCYALSIKYEYEMHEARKNGDEEAAQANEDAMVEQLEAGCTQDHAPSCEMLEKLKTSS